MLLNCDLGEGIDAADTAIMPHIDQANIACGFHAGSPLTLRRTLALAARHGVSVGAHPAYPDRENFGRQSMDLDAEEIIATIHYQVAALEGMARGAGLTVSYIKPHGALYHDMMGKSGVCDAILEATASYPSTLALMVQATTGPDSLLAAAETRGVTLLFEAFADRRYRDDGSLLPRSETGAVLERDAMLAQVAQLLREGTVTTASGEQLALQADTLCVHGDTPDAVDTIQAIRALVNGQVGKHP